MKPLNKRETAILRVLCDAPERGLSGYEITKLVYPRWLQWSAAIYVHLMHLENLRLIEHRRELVSDGTPRLPRYFYRITRKGRGLLAGLDRVAQLSELKLAHA